MRVGIPNVKLESQISKIIFQRRCSWRLKSACSNRQPIFFCFLKHFKVSSMYPTTLRLSSFTLNTGLLSIGLYGSRIIFFLHDSEQNLLLWYFIFPHPPILTPSAVILWAPTKGVIFYTLSPKPKKPRPSVCLSFHAPLWEENWNKMNMEHGAKWQIW